VQCLVQLLSTSFDVEVGDMKVALGREREQVLGERRSTPRDVLEPLGSAVELVRHTQAMHTWLGRILPQLHATAHRRVLFPCTKSFTAQLTTPAPLKFSTMISTLEYFPNMLVYHWHLSLRILLSSIMRLTKAISPPGVTISKSAPVQAERGGRDLAAAEARRSAVEA